MSHYPSRHSQAHRLLKKPVLPPSPNPETWLHDKAERQVQRILLSASNEVDVFLRFFNKIISIEFQKLVLKLQETAAFYTNEPNVSEV